MPRMTKIGTPLALRARSAAQTRARGRIDQVIAQPGFKKVAQHVERMRAAGLGAQELDELLDGARLCAIQMQIRNEYVGHVDFPRASLAYRPWGHTRKMP